MLNLKCNIEITTAKDNKKIMFDYVNNIVVNTSISNLTDTATVKLPRNMTQKGIRKGQLLTDMISEGDSITIQTGYEEHGLKEVFKGYITGIKSEVTKTASLLTLSCQNEMYKLKNEKNVDAEDIDDFDIKTFIESKAKITCEKRGNFSFGYMRIEQGKISAVLDTVKQKYPYIECYFQNNTLYVVEDGKLENPGSPAIVFDPSVNMVSDNLTYTEGKKICLIATAVDNDNVRIQVANKGAANETTDSEGNPMLFAKEGYDERHRYFPEITSKDKLQEYADFHAGKLTASRMNGTFTALGVPFVRKCDVVEIRDVDRPLLTGKKFIVEAVDYSFGTGGYRQTITLGREIK